MAQAQFLHGNAVMVDHTPGSAVTAGDVVVVGRTPLIAHRDIAANAQGALASGGGIYTVTGDAAIVAGRKVFWNDTTNKVTETASGNLAFGFTTSACSGDGSTCNIRHQPDGVAAA
jgi:predicted RecA/RadA family phage recombinase